MRLKRVAKFSASVTKGLLLTQQATLSQIVCGLLFCRSLLLAEIARGFETNLAFPHNLKRIARFVSNLELTRFCGQVTINQKGVHNAKITSTLSRRVPSKMVALVLAGRSPQQLAKEFEPTAQAISNWVKQADLDQGHRDDGLTSTEGDELQPLRLENRSLKEERDILKKAAAWFARETNSIPGDSSSL